MTDWKQRAALVFFCCLIFVPAAARGQEESPDAESTAFVAALRDGATTVTLRYRYERVDDDDFTHDGQASTLRTTLGYTTGAFHGFRVFLEAENVVDIGLGSLHNAAGRGGRGSATADRPTIADPAGTDFLRAGLEWSGFDTTLTTGRQEIVFDDARFVGNVGWRQHHQSFRGFRGRNASIGHLTAQYAYLDRVYRIFGDRQQTGTHLVNAQYAIPGVGTLTGYAYLLRYEDEPFRSNSTDTIGAEFKGRLAVGDAAAVRWEGELASVTDAGNSPIRVDAGYGHLLGGLDLGEFSLTVALETLGGNSSDGQFNTPLATLHAFNGWADRFLVTPSDGLRDVHLMVDGPLGPLTWSVRYHDFRAVHAARYGGEVDLQAAYTAPWKQGFVLASAFYDADGFGKDVRKLWLQTTLAF